jgi:SAM-dependent methyltransferase
MHRESELIYSTETLACPACESQFRLSPILDLIGPIAQDNKTADHYTKQWGSPLGFNRFLEKNKKAELVTMGKQLGWPALFDRIRGEAAHQKVTVYDAACGRGAIFLDLFRDPSPQQLFYLGADIHGALSDIPIPSSLRGHRAVLVRWDISDPLPVSGEFDYVICRASVHHTRDPRRTLLSLKSALKPGGILAISVYAKKAPMREAIDEFLRNMIAPMPSEEAYGVCGEFSLLGRDLQKSGLEVAVAEDLPLLGVYAGKYDLQSFIYDHFLKCWYNDQFGLDHSTAVNFDWYHPTYAYRFSKEELLTQIGEIGFKVIGMDSNKYQHYLELKTL